MKRNAINYVKVGDELKINERDITNHNKIGIVSSVLRDPYYRVTKIFMDPKDCEFLDRINEFDPNELSIPEAKKEIASLNIEWLKQTRINLGLSMEDVAKIMFTTKGTISRIEAGDKRTKLSTILLYELTLKELLRINN